ncbi:MAG: two-component regulator propeller domain-containing protein, partial [Saprospiraceae bacterium]|nr:two-component regulator propeller domain-containing protein [Saprospiraceae bacterium]
MRRSIFTWISIFWLLSSFLYGQEYIIDVQQFGIEEGLSHRNVHFALQDQRGLMWFGTDYGLNRFDGYNFKAITKKSNGLQSNEVKKALEDKNGLLWLLYGDTKVYGDKCPNIKGIDIFNPLTEEVQSFESFFNGNTKLQSTDFLTFTKKESGELAFLTKDYQLVIYDENGIFSSVNLEKKYNYLTNFHWSKNGNYWMSVKENYVSRQINIITINEAGKEIFNFPIEYYNNNIFSYQTQDNPNEKWIATSGSTLGYQFYEITPNGEIVKNQDEALFKELGVDISGFTNIAGFREHEGKYWLFSNNRFYLYDIKTKAHYIFNREYPDIGFSYQIFIDQQGKTWVSTQFGVFLISLKKNNFTKVFNQEKGLFPIRGLTIDPKNNLWAIQENLPNIWKASLSLDKKKVHHVEPVNGLKTPNRLPFGGIHFALHQSKTRDIIYSPGEHQIIKFNPEDFSKQKYTLSDLTKFPGKIWSIYQDNQGKIWAGTAKGNIVYNEHNNLYYFPLLESSNSQFHIYQFIEAGTSFWVVTEVGLFLIDKTTHQIQERYWSGGEGKYNLPFDKLYHGYQEKDDSFWLGTSGNGLVYFNTKTGDYKQYTKEEGLSNNVIYAVYPDNYQNLWLTSDYGIIRFNKVTRQVNTYLQKNGITHNEFNRISHSQSEDGTLFFGGLNGITVFHPNDFQTDSIISKTPLIISNFYQFVGNENKLLDKTNDLLKSHKITMAPNDPFFRLEFALLAYEDVDKIQYAYQISGIDRDWNYQKENT